MNLFVQKHLPAAGYYVPASTRGQQWGQALILADVAFLVLHLCLNFGLLGNRQFHLEVDMGYAELFQFLKLAVIIVLLLYLAMSNGAAVRVLMAAVMGFLLLEDAVGMHESFHLIGERFVTLRPWLGLSVQHLWEVIYGFAVGGVLLGLLLLAVVNTDDDRLRQRMVVLLVLLVVYGLFGVVIDALHGLLQHGKVSIYLESLFGTIEDWGEMITLSAITALVIDDAYRTASRKVLSGGPR